ncbi:MAG: polyphosphate polymerase domain-containing protein [Pseudolysinimonas sp.]
MTALAAITLDELNTVAALQTRVDRKYVLPRRAAEEVLAQLARLAMPPRALEIDGSREAAYESVYFDTPELLSYRMAATARRRRFKLRTRSYLDAGDAYLEVKTRGARSTTVKERLEYDIRDRDRLTVDARDYADVALEAIGVDASHLPLQPTLLTRYRRATLLLPGSRSRATVDTELEWEADDGRTLALPGVTIVETKSGSRPSELDRLLWSHGHRPATVSKYGTGMAALHPELPANKWTRVLRRHFERTSAHA